MVVDDCDNVRALPISRNELEFELELELDSDSASATSHQAASPF